MQLTGFLLQPGWHGKLGKHSAKGTGEGQSDKWLLNMCVCVCVKLIHMHVFHMCVCIV